MKSQPIASPRRPSKVPSPHDWRTTDEDEVNRRRARAIDEQNIAEALVSPLAMAWGASIVALRQFVEGGEVVSALDALTRKLDAARQPGYSPGS